MAPKRNDSLRLQLPKTKQSITKQESFVRNKLIMQYVSSYATINAGQMKRGNKDVVLEKKIVTISWEEDASNNKVVRKKGTEKDHFESERI